MPGSDVHSSSILLLSGWAPGVNSCFSHICRKRPSLFVGPVRLVRPVCICMSCVGAVDPVQVTWTPSRNETSQGHQKIHCSIQRIAPGPFHRLTTFFPTRGVTLKMWRHRHCREKGHPLDVLPELPVTLDLTGRRRWGRWGRLCAGLAHG